jgi:hypothetical protein
LISGGRISSDFCHSIWLNKSLFSCKEEKNPLRLCEKNKISQAVYSHLVSRKDAKKKNHPLQLCEKNKISQAVYSPLISRKDAKKKITLCGFARKLELPKRYTAL